MPRTFFIGDVHGCYDELLALVAKIWLIPEDHLYFVGDLINKWPKSLEVIEFVRNRRNTWSVIGNHEYFSFPDEKMLRDVDEGRIILSEWWKTWIHAQQEKSKPLEDILRKNGNIDWIKSLPRVIEWINFILVHAGFLPEYGIDTPIENATTVREYEWKPWYEYYAWDKLIIYGHWAAEWLRLRSNTIGLDTGCCFWGHLTAYCLESWDIWQVRANAVYTEPANWKEKEW